MKQDALHMSMTIPCKSEFVGVIRLAISGVATRMGFNIEEIEDIKISISEACTNAIQHAYPTPENQHPTINIDTYIHPKKLEVIVSDGGIGFNLKTLGSQEQKEKSQEKFGLGLGLTFIKSLMDETTFESTPGKGTRIRMVKNIPNRTTTPA